MSGVQTAAEVRKSSTGTLYEVIDSVNLEITSMENIYRNISASAVTMSDVYQGMSASAAVMSGACQGMNASTAAVSKAYRDMSASIDERSLETANEFCPRMALTASRTQRYIDVSSEAQGKFNSKMEAGKDKANGLLKKIKATVASYMKLEKLSEAFDLSDQLAATTARLNLMNDGLQSTENLQNMIFLAAEQSRGSYQATADAVAGFGITAGDAFGSSEETVAFVEQINKQFAIAGMEASDIDAAMQQLTQVMGEGVLGGAEYDSILAQAPNIIQTIADYMGVPEEQLKNMAAEGQITADIVKAAMFAAADETNAKFAQMPQTFAQIETSFQNNTLMAFQPVLQKMNEIANSEAVQGLVNGAIAGISVAAGIALELLNLLSDVADTVADNWSWLEPIVYGVAGALAVYYGAQVAENTIDAISQGLHIAIAAAQMMRAAATGTLTTATAAQIAAQNGLNTAMYACPIVWIIILIIALIAVFYAAVAAVNHFAGASVSATGLICGAVAFAGALILNTAIGTLNAILQWAWTNFVEPFIGIIEFVLNATNGGFDSFGDAVANLIGNIISWFLSLGKIVTKIIDAIFGTDWTSGLNALQDSVLEWGKNENAITLDRTAPMIDTRVDYGDAWNAGYSFGEGIDNSISSLFGGDERDEYEYEDDSTHYGESITDGIDEIGDNTGAIRDSMEITEEDLRYLRDIAEQEAVNRFTTAEIIIEQTNHNNVSGRMDLDGIVSGLTDAANEAVAVIAEGVYA